MLSKQFTYVRYRTELKQLFALSYVLFSSFIKDLS